MICCPFSVLCSNQAAVILPVFSEFNEAEAMNRFYSRAADIIYDYAANVFSENFAKFCCMYEVEEDKDALTVRLLLSLHMRGEKTERKTISHIWKNGNIIKKTVS